MSSIARNAVMIVFILSICLFYQKAKEMAAKRVAEMEKSLQDVLDKTLENAPKKNNKQKINCLDKLSYFLFTLCEHF